MKEVILLSIYWGSYVLVFWFILICRNLYRARLYLLGTLFLIGMRVFIWGRRIEPSMIRVQYAEIPIGADAKIALISDQHVGVYSRGKLLDRAIKYIDSLNVDMILIAGDHTYEPTEEQSLVSLLTGLGSTNIPIFAVLGNHDVEKPGPDLRHDLMKALAHYEVNVLNNDIVEFPGRYLVGLGPYLNDEDNVTQLAGLDDKPTVALAHNPDTIDRYSDEHKADLTLVGHTHCGQIRIPAFYKRAIPTEGDYDCGWTQESYTELYITPGLGEVMLPIRMFNPPTIDIITLTK